MQQEKRVAVVRAIPFPPHKRRWCGLERWVPDPEKRPEQEMEKLPQGGFKPVFDANGNKVWAKHALPWPENEVKVFVVDNPAPYDPDANGGVPIEISPSTLVMLQDDPRIAVKVLGGDGGDSETAIQLKAEIAGLEQKLQDAQRMISSLEERLVAARQEEKAAAQETIAGLRRELAQKQGDLAARKK